MPILHSLSFICIFAPPFPHKNVEICQLFPHKSVVNEQLFPHKSVEHEEMTVTDLVGGEKFNDGLTQMSWNNR